MTSVFNNDRLITYRDHYKNALLEDTIPFWLKHSLDTEDGGYLFLLNRDGSVMSTDKPVWIHGRFVWLLSTLYAEVEQKQEWLDAAKLGIEFLENHCFDTDGRMFFSVTKEGKPLRKRRYLFSEAFSIIAFAAYGRATKDDTYIKKALELFKFFIKYYTTPGLLEPKVNPEVRPMKGLAMPMITIATAQVLQQATDDPIVTEWIDTSIAEIRKDFMKEEYSAVLEAVGPNGEFYDTLEGRLICPGHSIECAWFILEEAKRRNNDQRLIETGLTILDWSFEKGWDKEYGGLLYFRDAKDLPPTEYWHDMKFWWQHNEAIIASVMAYQLTRDEKYALMFEKVHEWAHKHFPDPEYGEWFGYLHRDGRLSTPVKGNMWKGPFHIPRMQLMCWQMFDEMMR